MKSVTLALSRRIYTQNKIEFVPPQRYNTPQCNSAYSLESFKERGDIVQKSPDDHWGAPMSKRHTHDKHSEQSSSLKSVVGEILEHPDNPDPDARISKNTSSAHPKKLPPAPSHRRVTELYGGDTKVPVGVRVIHRHPLSLEEVHVLSTKPTELLTYLAVALIG